MHVYFEYICFMFASCMLPRVNGILMFCQHKLDVSVSVACLQVSCLEYFWFLFSIRQKTRNGSQLRRASEWTSGGLFW